MAVQLLKHLNLTGTPRWQTGLWKNCLELPLAVLLHGGGGGRRAISQMPSESLLIAHGLCQGFLGERGMDGHHQGPLSQDTFSLCQQRGRLVCTKLPGMEGSCILPLGWEPVLVGLHLGALGTRQMLSSSGVTYILVHTSWCPFSLSSWGKMWWDLFLVSSNLSFPCITNDSGMDFLEEQRLNINHRVNLLRLLQTCLKPVLF